MAEYKPCPFCGGEVDPTGWLADGGLRGPECEGCGVTAPNMRAWEIRAGPDLDIEYLALEVGDPIPLGMDPREAFEHHVQSPNLFRSLAKRLAEFAIYCKVATSQDEFPPEEGSIGPDCARASLVLNGMADVVEESQDNG